MSGLVWTGTILINPEQTFVVQIGRGGAGGASTEYDSPKSEGSRGTPTYLVPYSSANGIQHNGLVVIGSGEVLSSNGAAGPGARSPAAIAENGQNGTGNGGSGGGGGIGARRIPYTTPNGGQGSHDAPRELGAPGGRGGDGYVIISYDLPEG